MKKVVSRLLCLLIVLCMTASAFAITVVKVTGIKLDKASPTMSVGETQKLNVVSLRQILLRSCLHLLPAIKMLYQ
jgi:hypothetical protein